MAVTELRKVGVRPGLHLNRWLAAVALLAAGALGGGILGATLSASADPEVTPSTQASSPTQDTDGE